MSLYEILGVERTATQKEIKSAFRKLAQKLHPDKPTGDKEQYQKIQHAYEILSNEKSREHYDLTGDSDGAPNYHDMAMAHLSTLFSEILDGPMNGNIIELATGIAREQLSDFSDKERKRNLSLKKLEKHLNRVKAKKNENLFKMVVEAKISSIREQLNQLANNRKITETILDILKDYEDTAPSHANPFEPDPFLSRFGRGSSYR
jgi:curved DNA-binding protein CbpA